MVSIINPNFLSAATITLIMNAFIRMKAPMLEMYGAEFPKLWGDWCQAYRDFYNEKGVDQII